MIKFDFKTYTKDFINETKMTAYDSQKAKLKEYLEEGELRGWYNIDNLFNPDLINDIKQTASFIQANCDVFLIIGIGGSFLGAEAAIEALCPYFYNNQIKPQVYFVGNNLSSDYYYDLINTIKDKNIIVNVISKSGSTLETLVAYQLIMALMKDKYNDEELQKRIIITTDKKSGILREEVNNKGYKSFIFPDNIGGRYSVLSPVGLLPMAVVGIDIEKLYEGAREANKDINNQIRYSAIRKIAYDQGKVVEAFVVYEPKLQSFTEWLKQLYGESLGKNEQGTLPIAFINSRDLHSLGQFVQQGHKILFETVLNVEKSNHDVMISKYNKSLNEINNIASRATSMAHLKGSVLNNIITIDELNEEALGYLFQFFMISCAISGCLEMVNPFNQDGVEEYKNIMHNLLNN